MTLFSVFSRLHTPWVEPTIPWLNLVSPQASPLPSPPPWSLTHRHTLCPPPALLGIKSLEIEHRPWIALSHFISSSCPPAPSWTGSWWTRPPWNRPWSHRPAGCRGWTCSSRAMGNSTSSEPIRFSTATDLRPGERLAALRLNDVNWSSTSFR